MEDHTALRPCPSPKGRGEIGYARPPVELKRVIDIQVVMEPFSPANAAETAGFAYVHECRRVH
jgi:hypothetical protein